MVITKFSAQHYKSLDDIELSDLEPITILVGNNATGKSNVVDALRFVRDCIVDGVDHAISLRNGIGTVRQYSPTRPYALRIQVSLQQEIELPSSLVALNTAQYDLRLMSLRDGNYRIESEEVRWVTDEASYDTNDSGQVIEGQQADLKQHILVRDSEGNISSDAITSPRKFRSDELVLRSIGYEAGLWEVSSILESLRFSALYPNTLREPSRPDTDRQLKENGENWASVLKAMKSNDRGRRRFDVILALMKRVLPGLVDVKVQSVGGYLVPKFVVRDDEGQKEHDFDPVQLSDGTLRVFGILLAIYQTPPPKFLALEEPELTVNPGILAIIAEACKEVSDDTQLLITTHSPELIDFFDPSSIRVVSFHKGKTLISPIKSTQIDSIKEHLTTAGALLQMGNLQAEEI